MYKTIMNNHTSRITWIDDIKGFMLLLVCLAHWECMFFPLSLFDCLKVPFFFFFSGLLFPENTPPITMFLWKKVRSLLIPYIVLSLLFMFLDPRIYNVSFLNNQQFFSEKFVWAPIDSDVSSTSQAFEWYLYRIFIVGKSGPITGPLWFVETLFLSIVFFCFVRKIADGKMGVFLYSVICLAAGWLCCQQNLHLPFNIESFLSSSFFVGIGFLAKDYMRYFFPQCGETKRISISWKYVTVMVVSFFVLWIWLNIDGGFDLWNNSVGNVLGVLICTFFGFITVLSVFGLLKRISVFAIVSRCLAFLARNSYLFLCFHYIAKTYTRCFFNDTQFTFLPMFVITVVMMAVLSPLFDGRLAWMIGKKTL